MKITKELAQHYVWGDGCDSWHLLQNSALSIIQERIPLAKGEKTHIHYKTQQFYFILSGSAAVEIDKQIIELVSGEGIHIKPMKTHCITNAGNEDLHFLVISQPMVQEDRENIEL